MNGKQIKSLRLSLGLTQAELADEIGVHKISICRYETNVKKPIPIVVRALEALRQRRDKIRQRANSEEIWATILA